jgi:hypothetical protein
MYFSPVSILPASQLLSFTVSLRNTNLFKYGTEKTNIYIGRANKKTKSNIAKTDMIRLTYCYHLSVNSVSSGKL